MPIESRRSGIFRTPCRRSLTLKAVFISVARVAVTRPVDADVVLMARFVIRSAETAIKLLSACSQTKLISTVISDYPC